MAKTRKGAEAYLTLVFRGTTLPAARRARDFATAWLYDGGGSDGLVEGLDETLGITVTPTGADEDEVTFRVEGGMPPVEDDPGGGSPPPVGR